jgi:hypothetical protein
MTRPTELTSRLPLVPEGAEVLSPDLALVREDGLLAFFNAGGPIFECKDTDAALVRFGATMVTDLGLAPASVVAKAVGLHRATLQRARARISESGAEALQPKKRGPKGPHKLTPRVVKKAQELLDAGRSLRAVGAGVGVSEFAIRNALKRGLIERSEVQRPVAAAGPGAAVETMSRPVERATQDQCSELGVAVKRNMDRALAAGGMLDEAAPELSSAEAVPGAGALLALPAVLEQGLLEVGTKVYGRLSNGFFGLRSVLLTFVLMALLRIKTPEQLTEHAPGELGLLLGLDRAPEVKTLRRKLRELGSRGLAWTFMRHFTERWAKAEPRELALLYVDGHVRPYHGRKHALPKQHVQQRGRPMPGTKDFHVNDRRADPLMFVTAEATEGLLATLDTTLLPEVRRLVGSERRVTIVFDREGWSPKLFAKWRAEGFDVLTYRKGKQSRWREKGFEEVSGVVGGEKVGYRLEERQVKLGKTLEVREVRRLTDDGHQTAVITTNEKLSTLAVAHRMFSRWRQENFFRYMRHEHALDHPCTHEVELADSARLVANPERAALRKRQRAAKNRRAKLIERRVDLAPGKAVRVGGERLDEEGLDCLIAKTGAEIERLTGKIAALPEHVPAAEILGAENVVQLERERKVIADAIRLVAYRAESQLARLIEPFFERHEDEARKFLKTIFQATADLIPDERARRLTVRFHGLASPRATRALRQLCALVNESAVPYPGTTLRLHFEAPVSQE